MMRTDAQLLSWSDDTDAIYHRIANRRSRLKIVLKTRDDPDFLRPWVEHHKAIAGLENLVIFDNNSSDADVMELYAEIGDVATIVRFEGYHNDLHRPHKYPELYAALQASSDWFILLDTDERLVGIRDAMTVVRDATLAEGLPPATALDVIPSLWLDNVTGYEDRFLAFAGAEGGLRGARTGKPLISSNAKAEGLIGHNFQLDPSLLTEIRTSVLVLHLKHLSPRQRIRANVLKLRQYRVLSADEGLEEALSYDPATMSDGNPKQWVKELQRLHRRTEGLGDPDRPLSAGEIQINRDDSIVFYDERQAAEFAAFARDPKPVFQQALKRDHRG